MDENSRRDVQDAPSQRQAPAFSGQGGERDARAANAAGWRTADPAAEPAAPDAQPGAPAKGKGTSDLLVRFRSGFVYIAVSVACVLASDLSTVLYLAVCGAICAGEFYAMMRVDAKLVNEWAGIVAAFLYPVSFYFWGVYGVMGLTMLFMAMLVIWYVFWPKARISDVCISFFGAAYMGMLLTCLLVVRQSLDQPWGGVLLLVLMMSVWFNDVGAYLVGSHFGKHKMAPAISPKKSWEGFAGGLAVSVAFWCLMTLVPGVDMSIVQAVPFGMLSGAAGDLGDLAESRIKRNVGVKDSGTIMPGHGGLFDRSDSMFTSGAVAAVLLVLGGCVSVVW